MAKKRVGRPRKVGRPSKASVKARAKNKRRTKWARKHGGRKALKKIGKGKKVARAKALLSRWAHKRGKRAAAVRKRLAAARKVLRKAGVPMHGNAPAFKKK